MQKPAEEQVILNDLWNGIKAMSFFGHGGTDPATGETMPTFAGLPANKWKNSVFMDVQLRLSQDRSLSASEVSRRAEERSDNLGLELLRNYSCYSFYDKSVAQRFVKPGGLYYGVEKSLIAGRTVDYLPSCVRGVACLCTTSSYDLTEYRVPEKDVVQPPKSSSPASISEAACRARSGHMVETVKDWMKSGGHRAVYDAAGFLKGIDPDETAAQAMLMRHLKFEDGAVKPVRSGKEVEFYSRLKARLAGRKAGERLGMDDILRLGLDSCAKPDGTANVQEALLTIHNVVRLLARPQQWNGPGMKGDYGHPQSDPARPILQDLSDLAPVGEQTLPEMLGIRRKGESDLTAPLRTERALFDLKQGLFQAQSCAKNSEWNGGSHYYNWIGALARSTLGAGVVVGGYVAEHRAKDTDQNRAQGACELSHFICGSMFGADMMAHRQEFSAQAPAPAVPPKPASPAKFRVYLFRIWPPDKPQEVGYVLYLRIEETGRAGLFKFPDGNGGWYWRAGEVSGPYRDEEGVCAVLRGYGQTSVSYNLGWDPHITCSKEGPTQQPKLEQAQGQLTREEGTNRGGGDYKDFDLSAADPDLCAKECEKDAKCWAYTYVKPGQQGSQARCWLKNSISSPAHDDCCVSGARE